MTAPDDTTAPVAAEGLRDRLEQAELASEVVRAPDGNVSVIAHSNRTAADRAITVLAQLLDPTDLPARMAAKMARHTATDEHADTVCAGCQQGDRAAHLTEVAMSVRWEHAASQAAEVERLREIERVTAPLPDGADDMPEDPAEQREMWAFMVASWRWQQHMARKFSDQVERLRAELAGVREQLRLANIDAANTTAELAETEAERDALKAAIERAETLGKEWARLAPSDDWGDTLGDTAAADAGRALLAALAVPESPGDAETEDRNG